MIIVNFPHNRPKGHNPYFSAFQTFFFSFVSFPCLSFLHLFSLLSFIEQPCLFWTISGQYVTCFTNVFDYSTIQAWKLQWLTFKCCAYKTIHITLYISNMLLSASFNQIDSEGVFTVLGLEWKVFGQGTIQWEGTWNNMVEKQASMKFHAAPTDIGKKTLSQWWWCLCFFIYLFSHWTQTNRPQDLL